MLYLPSHESHLWVMEVGDSVLKENSRVVSDAFLRAVLSHYVDVVPHDFKFQKNPNGKPEISFPDFAVPLKFNLSHTARMVVCGVVWNHAIGVDVESVERDVRFLEVAERYFSDQETQDLITLPLEQQRERFFEYWTLKEAWIKARGESLGSTLSHISFVLHPEDKITISFSSKISEDSNLWQFSLRKLNLRYQVAVAIRRGLQPDLTISTKYLDLKELSF